MDPAPLSSETLAQHGQFVRQLARRLMRDEHEADDIAQGAWVRYFEAEPRNVLDPRGWFAAVVSNLVRNSHRARERRVRREELVARSAATSALDDDLAQASALRAVVEAVLALDEPYRSTVLARYFKNWEPARIARETNVPVATVKSRLQRAHGLLRTRLEREFGGPKAFGLALGALTDHIDWVAPSTTAAAAKLAVGGVFALFFACVGWWSFSLRESGSDSVAQATPEETTRVELSADSSPSKDPSLQGTRASVQSDEAPANELKVSGIVFDRPYAELEISGGPAANVELAITIQRASRRVSANTAVVRVTTDASGAFEARLANSFERGDRLRVSSAENEHFRAATLTEVLTPDVRVCDGLRLERAAHGLLEGEVVDAAGRPIAGARVVLTSSTDDGRELEVTADPAGALRVPLRGSLRSVRCADRNSKLFAWEPPTRLEGGGQSGLRIVLASNAQLSVRVTDSQQRGLSGIPVSVELDASELRSSRAEAEYDGSTEVLETDADGRVTFASVWSEHKLRVRVADDVASSVRGGWLSFDEPAELDAPLVLAPGEARELGVAWKTSARIRGSTANSEGTPIAGAVVELFDGVEDGVIGRTPRAATKSDGEGRFTLDVRHRELEGALRLAAGTSERSHELDKLGSMHMSCSGAEQLGSVSFDAQELARGELEFDLVLEPTLSLSGRIVDADGKPLDGRNGRVELRAAPSGASSYAASVTSASPEVRWSDDGQFQVVGLTRGAWDLFATRVDFSFYTWAHGTQSFRGFQAGSAGHELRYEPGGEVIVEVRLDGEPVDGGVLLRGALDPRDGERVFAPAEPFERIERANDWPTGAMLGFTGIGGHDDDSGRWRFGFDRVPSAWPAALPPLLPGIYMFGLAPRRGDTALALQASEPRFYAAGRYVIEFATVATTTLEGSLSGDLGARRWAIELLDARGESVPLESRPGAAQPSRILEVDARGRFVARRVPVGQLTLRVGTLHELAHGGAHKTIPLELESGRTSTLDVRIP